MRRKGITPGSRSLPKLRGQLDDATVEGGEEAVVLLVEGVDFCTREAAKSREHELVPTQPKDGTAKSRTGAILDADSRMEMTTQVKAIWVCEFFVRIMKDVKAVLGAIACEREVLP